MSKHQPAAAPIQSYTQIGVGSAGVEATLDLTVTLSYPHQGACPRVRAAGHGAEALRDAILAIVERNAGSHSGMTGAFREIREMFAEHHPERSELRAALDEAAESLALARKLLAE